MSTTLNEESTQEPEEKRDEVTVVETKSTSSGFILFNVLFILAMIAAYKALLCLADSEIFSIKISCFKQSDMLK